MEAFIASFTSPGPELFRLGPFVLRWYGLLIAIAVLIGLNLSSYLAKQNGLKKNLINDLLPFLVLSSLIGARIYYVTFEWRQYKDNWLDVLAIYKGGIAIHGALIGGSIAVFLFCRFNKQPFWDVLDTLLPSVALGQAIGRWGNFFNHEAFGLPTDLPWKLSIPLGYRPEAFINEQYFHPTFLYESIWNIGLFILLIILYIRRLKGLINIPTGGISCIYLITYSLGRFLIESLRVDPLCFGGNPPFCDGGLRVAQLMSLLLLSAGVGVLCRLYSKQKTLSASNTHSSDIL